MKIKKLGHSCFVVDEKGLRILVDPGSYTTSQEEERNIGVVLITHEHPDHLHVESLKKVLESNPEAVVITNKSVGTILDKEGIKYEIVLHGQSKTVGGVLFEGFGEKHAAVYGDIGVVENTGYFMGERLFYPGDSFYNPGKSTYILALPAGGPWMKFCEAVDYAKAVSPQNAFPVHDAMFKSPDFEHERLKMILEKFEIKFVPMKENDEIEL